MKNNRSGFTTLEILIAILSAIIIGFAGFYILSKPTNKPIKIVSTSTKPIVKKQTTISTNAPAPTSVPQTKPSTTTTTQKVTSNPPSSSGSGGGSNSPPPSSNPTVTIIIPTNGQVFTSVDYTYSCSFTTSNGIGTISAVVKDSNGNLVYDGFTINNTTSDNCYEQSENTNNSLPNGNYSITFTVTDSQGRTASATNHFTWDL